MTKGRLFREFAIMAITSLALYHAARSIYGSIERQVFLHSQVQALKQGQRQSQEVHKDLHDGLANYRSTAGLERLARERLNLGGKDEVIIRIAK